MTKTRDTSPLTNGEANCTALKERLLSLKKGIPLHGKRSVFFWLGFLCLFLHLDINISFLNACFFVFAEKMGCEQIDTAMEIES